MRKGWLKIVGTEYCEPQIPMNLWKKEGFGCVKAVVVRLKIELRLGQNWVSGRTE